MSNSDLVRFSREGDQFHYVWAARRCLRLLSPISGLVAVTIEGASTSEIAPGRPIEAGEELIDIAEYYGNEHIAKSTCLRYIQLKHSTQHALDPWTPSGLKKTLTGFAERYRALKQLPQAGTLSDKLEFWFVSNRPISPDFLETVDDVANRATPRHPKDLKKLMKLTGLARSELSVFCKLLRLQGKQDGYWDQRNILTQEITGYLPDADADAPVQLKELITRKALPESAQNPTITKMDMLRALKTDEAHLFPAPCRIEDTRGVVPREQEADLIGQIANAANGLVIIHADSGVGKSIFANRIKLSLPQGSMCIVYDCFGNGQYRNASAYRHRHKDALVQIANELAGLGLCHPLIPTWNADATAYVRAFLYRVRQTITSLKAEHRGALLCIAIDAADNAQMAAEEIGEPRSFVRDLIREQMPEGVRLVALCRTHRQDLLDAPPRALRLELQPFTLKETAAHLRYVFPEATEQDVDEFDRLSSHNPRVQAMALSRKVPLQQVLRELGPIPTTVEDTIKSLLDHAVADLCDRADPSEKARIELICAGLAALRPPVPISVLASISGVHPSAVRSFAVDLGRPLIMIGDTLQFFDEPAETWFREHFKPKATQLTVFIETLKPLASNSAYAAAALPQLMLEAGQFAELVELALSSTGLPEGSPVEKRDVELQRLQFALKASLRAKRYAEAAKLALKAGGETAGGERQQKLFQENTDLASVLIDADRIQEIVSRRTFGGGWIGSHHVYEAGILSGRNELRGDARSRLRMAHEWLNNWSRLSNKQRKTERIDGTDIAELAMAHFNIDGADSCAWILRPWKPRGVSFRASRIVARRFVDHGRYDDLDHLAVAARNNLFLVLAITLELQAVHRNLPRAVVERALRLIGSPHVKLKDANDDKTVLRAVTALVEAGYTLSLRSAKQLVSILTRYLPDNPPRSLSNRLGSSRFPLLRAYTLRAALVGRSLQLVDLAYPELRAELEKNKDSEHSRDAREFNEDIGALLPWHRLWADTFLGLARSDDLAAAIAGARSESLNVARINYRDESYTSDEIALLWLDILVQTDGHKTEQIAEISEWIRSLKRPLYTPTLTQMARLGARTSSMGLLSLDYASKAFALTRDERADAETKAGVYVGLARAILTISKSEAAAYFDQAVDVASKIGDENLDRWTAILDLANRAANPGRPTPEIAYKLARCAELTYDYVARDKHFDWEETVRVIASLCPSSSLAILSRWRDRDFGRAERLLPVVINFLVDRRRIDPVAALGLIGFRAHWERSQPVLLKSALDACASKTDKEHVLAFLYRYIRLDDHSSSAWRNIKEVCNSHGLTVPDIEGLIAFSERKEQAEQSMDGGYHGAVSMTLDREDERDWDAIFSGIDLSSADSISRAYARFRDAEPPYYHERFFKELCARVAIGKEPEFVTVLSDIPEFDLYHFRNFLEQIPEAWKTRLAFKSALAHTLKAFCRRYCMAITNGRYYEVLPFKTACELSGVPEGEVVDVVLSAIGDATQVVGVGRLFTLIGLLVSKLSDNDALEALSFGLTLFDGVLEHKDGDGPWSTTLVPPTRMETAIAGYIWAGLAAPEARLRWEAAHVVRGLCILGRSDVLESLINLANGTTAGPFSDARLHFYHLHARQWLLIALARAAGETPTVLAAYADFFMHLALLDQQTHVLIRGFAAKTLLTLVNQGSVQLGPPVLDQLRAVNTSQLSMVSSRRHERRQQHVDPMHRSSGAKTFVFGYDISRYWFQGLGDCFAQTAAEIEEDAEKVICDDWGLSESGRWDSDERARRGFFRNMASSHSHGSYPRRENLNFYLSYHAMMTVAGKLLFKVPVHQDPEDPKDEFGEWLSDHSLSRKDGNWLADRRDPVPLDWPDWKDEKPANDWRWGIRRNDFERVLRLSDGKLNVWGSWTSISGNREEAVHVRSALVSRNRSEALLRALQTAGSPDDYRVPSADDELQIDHGEFRLKGWILDQGRDRGLDELDPWACDIRYPPIKPAKFVLDLLQLRHDFENRTWSMPGDEETKVVLWSEIWSCHPNNDDQTSAEHGRRLQASLSFVLEFLHKMDMDLIVEVEIQREIHRSRYESQKEDDLGYIPPSARVFVIKSDGSINSL